jgi:anti-anti-sigma factor
MEQKTKQSLLQVRIVEGTTVVSFENAKALLDDGMVQAAKTALLNFMENMGHRKFHLCLDNTPTVNSSALAMLVMLQQKLTKLGGQMTISGISKGIDNVLEVTKLDSFFTRAEPPKPNRA